MNFFLIIYIKKLTIHLYLFKNKYNFVNIIFKIIKQICIYSKTTFKLTKPFLLKVICFQILNCFFFLHNLL